MAQTSMMVDLGTKLPDATLIDVRTGEDHTLSLVEGKALVVMFICNHCPYVKHVRHGLAEFGRDYSGTEVGIVAISSNDAEAYPDDSPSELARIADEVGYPFPVLHDEDQSVAKAFGAVCTPDFFVFGPDRTLAYRGQFDGSRPGNDSPVTGTDLRTAVDAIASGASAPADQTPSMGCSIKWKPGNEPD